MKMEKEERTCDFITVLFVAALSANVFLCMISSSLPEFLL